VTKKVKIFPDPLVFACKGGFSMRASDNSVGGEAGQFRTTCWAVAMFSAGGPSQSVPLALSGALPVAKGGLSQ